MATIATSCPDGDPELGHRHPNGLWRAVIGWNHTTDTPQGLQTGRIWCWVTSNDRLQIFDQEYNRASGQVRDCGVGNYTMIRMFHPYFCRSTNEVTSGNETTVTKRVPVDGVREDKERCRSLYKHLIYRHRLGLGLPVDDQSEQVTAHVTTDHTRHTVDKIKRATAAALGMEEYIPGGCRADAVCISESSSSSDLVGAASTSTRIPKTAHLNQLSCRSDTAKNLLTNSQSDLTQSPVAQSGENVDSATGDRNEPSDEERCEREGSRLSEDLREGGLLNPIELE